MRGEQRLPKVEMMSVVNNSTDQLNSVAAAMQSIATNAPSAATPRRTSDLIPKNWEGSVGVIFLMEALCLWMQVWSDQLEKMQVRVECTKRSTPIVCQWTAL